MMVHYKYTKPKRLQISYSHKHMQHNNKSHLYINSWETTQNLAWGKQTQ